MALLADVTVQGGVRVKRAYLRVVDVRIRESYSVDDFGGRVKAFGVSYRVDAYLDAKRRHAGGERLPVAHLETTDRAPMGGDGLPVYDPDGEPSPFAVAYAHLRQLPGVGKPEDA